MFLPAIDRLRRAVLAFLLVVLALVVALSSGCDGPYTFPDAPSDAELDAAPDVLDAPGFPYCRDLGCGPDDVTDQDGLPSGCYATGALCYCRVAGVFRPCLPEPTARRP